MSNWGVRNKELVAEITDVWSQNNAQLARNFNQMPYWAKALPPTNLLPTWEGKCGLNKKQAQQDLKSHKI